MDDLELARILRDARLRTRLDPQSNGSRAFAGRVTTTLPVVGKFINVIPQSITGNEVEGGSATITDLGTTATPVYLVGPGVPATGDQVLARWVDWRWVARKRTSSGGGGAPRTVICNGCSGKRYPNTLYLTAPSLGVTSLPLTYDISSSTWKGQADCLVSGYAVCAWIAGGSVGCINLTTVTTAFKFSINCPVSFGDPWKFGFSYGGVYQSEAQSCGYTGATSLNAYRATDQPIAGISSGCSSAPYYSGRARAFFGQASTTIPCPSIISLSYPSSGIVMGGPVESPPITTVPNYYVTSGVTVTE